MENLDKIFSALNKLSYGLYIVSSAFDGKKNGQLANTVFQITPNPPKIAIALNKGNLTHEMVDKSGLFSVSVLEEETPLTFIGLFGFKSGRDIDKFEKVSHQMDGDCPIVIENALSCLKAKVVAKMDAGSHTLFMGEIISGQILKNGTALTYDFYQKNKKGKTHKNATTFNKITEK
ncbi:MAG: flavin reductase family protein [Elusimicrobia bacterium]|nr:flavin reductase family protein [Elusimicrobiota bacterium]